MTDSEASSNFSPIFLVSNICNLITIKLDSSNHVLWKFQTTTILKAHGLFGLVDGTSSCPSMFIGGLTQKNPDYINWCTQDQALMTFLNASLSATALSHVVGCSSSRKIWLRLEERFGQEYYDAEQFDNNLPYKILKSSMDERLRKKNTAPCNWSIYRVPSRLRELNKDAYTPHVVSIGPFHWGKKELEPMEVHKTRYMKLLLQRTSEAEVTLEECCKAILSMEERAHYCYYEIGEEVGSKKIRLAEILLVDGCFILELFIRGITSSSGDSMDNMNDPIFGNAWMVCCLQRDLALLENQIPMFVLECLFDLIIGRILKRPSMSLNEYCLRFFHSTKLNLNPEAEAEEAEAGNRCNINITTSSGGRHLLDVIRNSYLPSYPKTEPKRKHSWEFIHSVTKLRESGIEFVQGNSDNLFDIKFNSCRGVLKIPRLHIHDSTDSLLRNLIAFEQCCHEMTHHITSYALLMDRLIDSPEDAEFLEQNRVIANYLGHGVDVSKLFNMICKEVVVKDFFFAALCEQIDEHYKSWWPQNKAVLARDYCSNPCKSIAFAAACFLLILTAFQTGYTIASYYPH